MAHDINFTNNKTGENIAYFFGYADGIWYKGCDAAHCYGGVSGNGNSVIKTASEMKNIITVIEKFKAVQSYPDPNVSLRQHSSTSIF